MFFHIKKTLRSQDLIYQVRCLKNVRPFLRFGLLSHLRRLFCLEMSCSSNSCSFQSGIGQNKLWPKEKQRSPPRHTNKTYSGFFLINLTFLGFLLWAFFPLSSFGSMLRSIILCCLCLLFGLLNSLNTNVLNCTGVHLQVNIFPLVSYNTGLVNCSALDLR